MAGAHAGRASELIGARLQAVYLQACVCNAVQATDDSLNRCIRSGVVLMGRTEQHRGPKQPLPVWPASDAAARAASSAVSALAQRRRVDAA